MRERLLKILAVAAFGMVSFPVVLTGDAHSFENVDPLRLCAYYAAFLAVFALGYALGQVTKRRKKLLPLCRILGVGTFFLSLFLVQFTDGVTVIFATGAAAVFWYFLGERASRKHYADFFPIFAFGVQIVVTLLSYFTFSFSAPEELVPPVRNAVIGSFLAEFCLAALLINQSGIYDKATRRRETKAMLPRGLSGYNAALVLLITGAGFALYLFSDKIVWFLWEVVRLIARLILALMRVPTNFFVPAAESEDPDGLLNYNEPSEEWKVLMVLMALIAIALIIVFRKQIWRWLKNVGRAIRDFFSREAAESGEPLDFVDLFEEAPSLKRQKTQTLTDAQLLKKYRAQTDPLQKYRLGYRLLLRKMNRANAHITPSDTASAHLEKGRKVYGEALSPVVEGYNVVRYHGEAAESEPTGALEKLLGS